jgi:transposase
MGVDAPLDLYSASREDLIRLIVRQRERIADLEREQARWQAEVAAQRQTIAEVSERVGVLLAALEARDGDEPTGHPTGMPGLKPAPRAAAAGPERPVRRRRARGFGRARMAPTARQVHAVAQCPHCRTPLRGGTVARTREVIEVVPAPVVVTEHVYVARRCPRCGGRWQPEPERDGLVVGQGRLGVGLLSLIAVLREALRLPIAGIQWYLRAVHGVHVSVGGIVGAVRTVARCAAGTITGLHAAIRAGPVLHADETGWREDGVNGYAWTFSTTTDCLFVHGGRDRGVLDAAIGADYAGVLVSDFYAVSTGYEGRHQYCWAHLLRDVDALVAQHPTDAAVVGWADAVHALYRRATAAAADPGRDPAVRRRQRQGYEAELGALCAPFLDVAEAPQRGLAARMTKHVAELFVFVEDPIVPSTNNAAERSRRHPVTSRKISGGTRSPAGTATKMTLATLFGTWRRQGLDPLVACRALLSQSQL